MNRAILQNSIFKFNSNFLLFFINVAFFWNHKHERSQRHAYKHTPWTPRLNDVETTVSTSFQRGINVVCLYFLSEKRPRESFLTICFFKLWEAFWIHCCIVSKIFEKPHWKRSFVVISFVWCREFLYRYFLTFSETLWESLFRQPW